MSPATPGVRGLVDHRGGERRDLGLAGVRVGLEAQFAVGAEDLVLVTAPDRDVGDEQLPHAAGAQRAHRVQASVPRVEVADHADRAGRRCPHGEGDALRAFELARMGAELVVDLAVAALADQVQVELADGRA